MTFTHTVDCPEYMAWSEMRRRCRDSTRPQSKDWVGRGITVCPEWESFENFVAAVGPRPDPSYSIDRIDNNEGYKPGNVHWATRGQQTRNRRSNVWIEFNGIRKVYADWAKDLGITKSALYYWMKKGRTPQEALLYYVKQGRLKGEPQCQQLQHAQVRS